MKKIFLSFIFFALPLATYSVEEENCELGSFEAPEIMTSMLIPNCTQTKQLLPAKKGNFKALCESCKSEFEASVKRNTFANIPETKLDIKETLVNELKKSLSANLFDIVALRSVYSTEADFKEAISACSSQNFEDELKKNNCSDKVSLKDLRKSMAEELGRLLSKKPHFDDQGVLDRTYSQSSCEISDVEIMRAKAFTLESSIDDVIITALNSKTFNTRTELERFFQVKELETDFPFTSLFSSHPILSQLMEPPKDLIEFFKQIPKPMSKDSLRAHLSSQKKANEKLVSNIADKCRQSYSNFIKLACRPGLDKAKAKIPDLNSSNILIGKTDPYQNEFTNLDNIDQKLLNSRLMAMCELRSEGPEGLEISGISSWMPQEHAQSHFNDYRKHKYENEIGSARRALCEIYAGKASCEEGTYTCELYKALEAAKSGESFEGRLAKSSDPKVNELLRSFIGAPESISAETKTVLVAEGILPKNSKGEFVEQPTVPERRPEYVKRQSEIANVPASSTTKNASATSANASASASAQRSSSANQVISEATPELYNSASYVSGLFPELSASEQQELSSIHEEILRRLQGPQGNTVERKPVTKQQAQEAVREAFKKQNRPLSATQERALADQFYETSNNAPILPQTAQGPRAELSSGDDSPQEKWRKEQELRALSGMFGARTNTEATDTATGGSNRAPASIEAEGKLSTVAINAPTEKVRLSLTDLLNDKIISDEFEGQQLKMFLENKENFILQVNNTSFNVIFDKSVNSFVVDFADGDHGEAAKIKPQLEKFFNRVKVSLSDMKEILQ